MTLPCSSAQNKGTMTDFKRYYIILAVALLLGIGGSLFTPLGWHSTIGNVSAGLTVGVLITLYVLRVADLRAQENARATYLEFHPSQELAPSTAQPSASKSESADRNAIKAEPRRSDNILPFTTTTIEVKQAAKAEDDQSVRKCACICGCKWKSKDKIAELCGNCRRWWQQQTLRCKCDYIESDACVCGAIKHKPAPSTGLGAAA